MGLFANTQAQTPKQKRKLLNINDDQLNSNQQSVPVKYLAGRAYVSGDFITPAYNPRAKPKTNQSGKGQSGQVTGYVYYADFAMVFCMGGQTPVNAVYTVVVDSDIVWTGNITRTSNPYDVITVPNYGTINLYWGTNWQPIDSILLTPRSVPIGGGDPKDSTTWPPNTGSAVVSGFAAGDPNPFSGHYDTHPAYRGQCYGVFKNWRLGRDRTQVPTVILELARGTQWLPQNASFSDGVSVIGTTYTSATAKFDPSDVGLGITGTNIPSNTFIYAWNSTSSITLSANATAAGSALSFTILSRPTTLANDVNGVNPIGVLYEAFVDTRFGLGMPVTNIDTTSFQNAQTGLEGLGPARLSVYVTESKSLRQFTAEILEYYDGWIRRSGTQVQAGYWTHGTPTSVATLTDDYLLAEPELSPQGWGPTVNQVTVVYADKDHHFNAYSQQANDPNNFRITGYPRPITLHRPFITSATLAKRYATEYAKMNALPFTAGTLHVKREWLITNSVMHGMVITYNSAFYGLSFLLRVLEIQYEADKSAKAEMTVEWERAQWPSVYIPPGYQGPGGFVIGPRNIWQAAIGEVPYLLSDLRYVAQLIPMAIRGNIETQSYRVWISVDGGTTYTLSSGDCTFFSFGILASAIGTGDPSMNVWLYGFDWDTQVTTQQVGDQTNDALVGIFLDTGEIVSCGSVTSIGGGQYTIGILRGRMSTPAASHAATTYLMLFPREKAVLINNAAFTAGLTVYAKFQPMTQDNEVDIASITPVTHTITGFPAIAPPVLSPAPTAFTGSVTVTATATAGLTIRGTIDGTDVDVASPVYPGGGVSLSATTTVKARAFAADGRFSSQITATYTLLAAGTTAPTPTVAVPTYSFTGVKGVSGGTITLTAVTGGSSIFYSLNGAAYVAYSAPITLNCTTTGDSISFTATLSGYNQSAVTTFDNTKQPTGGGFGGPYGGRHPPP